MVAPEAWHATRAQTSLSTQIVRDKDDYLAVEKGDVGRSTGPNERELFVSCDAGLALQQQFEHLRPEFLVVHDIGTASSRKLLSGIAAASGRALQKLVIRRQGYGKSLGTLFFIELPAAGGIALRMYTTESEADPVTRVALARMLLAFSRLGVIMVGDLTVEALRPALKALRDDIIAGPWHNRHMLLLPLASASNLVAQGMDLAQRTGVNVRTTPVVARPAEAWGFISDTWRRLSDPDGGTASGSPAAPALAPESLPARPAPPPARASAPAPIAAPAAVPTSRPPPAEIPTLRTNGTSHPAFRTSVLADASRFDPHAAQDSQAFALPTLVPRVAPAAAPVAQPTAAPPAAQTLPVHALPVHAPPAHALPVHHAPAPHASAAHTSAAQTATAATAAATSGVVSMRSLPPTAKASEYRAAAPTMPMELSEQGRPINPPQLQIQAKLVDQNVLPRYVRLLSALNGLSSCCVFDVATGNKLAHAGTAPGPIELGRQGQALMAAMLNASHALGCGNSLPEAAVTLETHHLLLRAVPHHPGIALHAVFDKATANLTLARLQVLRLDALFEEAPRGA